MLTIAQNNLVSLENAILSLPQVSFMVEHFNIPGVYVRALHIPKDHVLTGCVHNHECINIVAKGDITVSDGDKETRLKAGSISISPPGTKRAGFAHDDTLFVTIHRTDLTDIEAIENELVSKSFDEYFKRLELKQ
jgi:quercetin dioxygenase-like cupin family protein